MEKVIEYFGSQVKLANALNKKYDLNITTSHVYYWIKNGIPIKRAKQIEKLTDGLFNRRYLRPDIFD